VSPQSRDSTRRAAKSHYTNMYGALQLLHNTYLVLSSMAALVCRSSARSALTIPRVARFASLKCQKLQHLHKTKLTEIETVVYDHSNTILSQLDDACFTPRAEFKLALPHRPASTSNLQGQA
jgi:hypothetical protein